MDRDLGRLHDATRGLMIERRDELIRTKESDSVLKKQRKALSQLDWDISPEMADALDDMMSRGATADEIRSYIRGIEEKALKDFQTSPDDSVHHKVQSRTGGDTLADAKGQHVRNVVKRLQDKYGTRFANSSGPGGNLTADLSLSNFAHKADDRARGAERASGIGKNPNKATTAHAHGTAGYAKALKASEIADEESLFKALDERVGPQLKDAEQGIKTDRPRQLMIRELTGDNMAYHPAATADDVAKTRAKYLTLDPKDVEKSYQALTQRKKLQMPRNAGFATAPDKVGKAGLVGGTLLNAGSVIEEALGGNYSAAGKEALKTGMSALAGEAVQRGGTAVLQRVAPRALQALAPIARVAGPIGLAIGAVDTMNSIVKGATGKDLVQTGQAANETRNRVIQSEGRTAMRRMARRGTLKSRS